jgi:hypothetical protein
VASGWSAGRGVTATVIAGTTIGLRGPGAQISPAAATKNRIRIRRLPSCWP